MAFRDALSAHLKEFQKVYDLAAFCYDYLLEILERFSMQAEHILWKRNESGLAFSECMSQIQIRLLNLKLKEYGESVLNDASAAFFLLQAVDRYVQEERGRFWERAPLNRGYCERVYVYMDVENSILDEAASENDFSDMIRGLDVRSQLSHLIILEKKELPQAAETPEVAKLWIGKSDQGRQKIVHGKEIKIAVIPFGEYEMLEFPVSTGALFHVQYKESHIKTGIRRALSLLEMAIKLSWAVQRLSAGYCRRRIPIDSTSRG